MSESEVKERETFTHWSTKKFFIILYNLEGYLRDFWVLELAPALPTE
jgi:hypothetical protein